MNACRYPSLVALLVAGLATPLPARQDIYDSGGQLLPEQAAYDVEYYDLALAFDPDSRSIAGSLTAHVRVVTTLEWLVLDLDTVLHVDSVHGVTTARDGALNFRRNAGKLWIELPRQYLANERVAARVFYGGRPLSAPHRQGTWADGVVWTLTEDGAPWIGIVSVLNGADIWWPVKDHPSDETDSMALHITVPDPLVVASNGRLRGVDHHDDGTATHHWFVSDPINNYGVTVNIAPYQTIESEFTSVTGQTIPVTFWVLPEHYDAGARQFPQFLRHLRFLEGLLGPYPFRADKYGVAETPYLGMENQSIISYGSDFSDNDYGFDWLHFHELTHEWWANMVTARDWKDWWLHESFGTYMEALYVESLHGEATYLRYMAERRSTFQNRLPLAPRVSQSTRDIYGGDIYSKGAWVLHTLRSLIGRDALLRALRSMAYPPESDGQTGCRCRLTDTREFVDIVNRVSGRDVTWFFDVYLRQAEIPRLHAAVDGDSLRLRWDTAGLPFSLPVDITVGNETVRVAMDRGSGSVALPGGAAWTIDAAGWILMDVVRN